MKNATLVKTVLIAACLPLLASCVVYRDRPVYVQQPPSEPPPQVEVVPVAPDPTFVWIGGYYDYGPRGWVWVGGRWAPRPHPGAVWMHGHWGYRGHTRVWVSAGWH